MNVNFEQQSHMIASIPSHRILLESGNILLSLALCTSLREKKNQNTEKKIMEREKIVKNKTKRSVLLGIYRQFHLKIHK